MTIHRRAVLIAAAAAAAAACLAAPATLRAQTRTLKLSHSLPPQHQINAELIRWSEGLRAATDGALQIEVFPAGQMGPPPRQYDLARTGAADFAFVFTAFNPGRFPRTDLLGLPFAPAGGDGAIIRAAGASWIASALAPELAGDFRGVEMLYAVATNSLGFFMRETMILRPEDLKGLRVRPSSKVMSDQIAAMGASPAPVGPAELADAIAKGVVDGACFNFEGGRAFQLQQSVRKVSMLGFTGAVFALVAGEKTMRGLPAELAQAIRDAGGPEAGRHVGGFYDSAEDAGRAFMAGEGVEIEDLDGARAQPFREALADVGAAQKAEAEGQGVDVAGILDRIAALKAQA